MPASLGSICLGGLQLRNEDENFILHHPLCPLGRLMGCARAGEHQHVGSPQGMLVCIQSICDCNKARHLLRQEQPTHRVFQSQKSL